MRKKQNPVNEVYPLTDHKNQCTFNSAYGITQCTHLNKLQNLTEKSQSKNFIPSIFFSYDLQAWKENDSFKMLFRLQ